MSVYYIRAELDGDALQIALDATTNSTEKFGGRLTKFVLEDGLEGSDHYIVSTDRVSFTGVLSDSKSRSSGWTSPATLQEQNDGSFRHRDAVINKNRLERIRHEKIPFSVYTGDKVITDCRFTNLEFRQAGPHGIVGQLYSYAVSFTAEQIRTGSRAQEAAVRSDELLQAYTAKAVIPGNKKSPAQIQKERIDAIMNLSFGGAGGL